LRKEPVAAKSARAILGFIVFMATLSVAGRTAAEAGWNSPATPGGRASSMGQSSFVRSDDVRSKDVRQNWYCFRVVLVSAKTQNDDADPP
jgi:hypothetical protein